MIQVDTPLPVVGTIVGHDRVPPEPKIWASDDECIPLDGRALSREEYPVLYATIGTTYGGEGELFHVPDLTTRFVVWWNTPAVDDEPPTFSESDPRPMHAATAHVLKFFKYQHLPPVLQAISKPFHDLAHWMVDHEELDGPELTVALRKLLEAKDAAVRSRLD